MMTKKRSPQEKRAQKLQQKKAARMRAKTIAAHAYVETLALEKELEQYKRSEERTSWFRGRGPKALKRAYKNRVTLTDVPVKVSGDAKIKLYQLFGMDSKRSAAPETMTIHLAPIIHPRKRRFIPARIRRLLRIPERAPRVTFHAHTEFSSLQHRFIPTEVREGDHIYTRFDSEKEHDGEAHFTVPKTIDEMIREYGPKDDQSQLLLDLRSDASSK